MLQNIELKHKGRAFYERKNQQCPNPPPFSLDIFRDVFEQLILTQRSLKHIQKQFSFILNDPKDTQEGPLLTLLGLN